MTLYAVIHPVEERERTGSQEKIYFRIRTWIRGERIVDEIVEIEDIAGREIE